MCHLTYVMGLYMALVRCVRRIDGSIAAVIFLPSRRETNQFVVTGRNKVISVYAAGVESSAASLPSSSYRLGVRSAPLHDIYNDHCSRAIREALQRFEKRMPGFVSDRALLHGCETRTSAPVQV